MTTEKKQINNVYIKKVEDHEKIINDEKKAFDLKWKWWSYFWNNNDIVLEIWTWLGNFFSSEISKNPDKNYIWKDIRFKRIFVTAEKSIEKWWNNFVLLKTKWENIDKVFEDLELTMTYIFFPDPWAKKERQRKNRLFSDKFISDLYDKTKSWWKIIFKTDHREYFDFTLDLIKSFWKWNIDKISYDYENELLDFDKKNMTEFEEIVRKDKIQINYLELKKAGQ